MIGCGLPTHWAGLALIDAAMAEGQLSYSKVRALARVATAENEAELLDIARAATAAQLEKICRLYKGCKDPRDSGDLEEQRWIISRQTDEGMVRVTMQLLPDEAAAFLKAAESSAEDSGARVDGVVEMADAVLRGDAATRAPVDISVHIDAESLQSSAEDFAIAPSTLSRLCCDAGLVPVLQGGGGMSVGRKTRVIRTAMRRALALRDGGCRFPGCTATRVDGHHIEHWIDGGETSLDNLVSLCRGHHTLLHEGGCSVESEGDELVFRGRQGQVLPACGPRRGPVPGFAEEGLDPWRLTATDASAHPPDLHYMVDALLSAERVASEVLQVCSRSAPA